VEGFLAAVDNGADAVYLGLKQLSARASAVNFTLDELALLIPYARKRHVSIYVALNSLMAATEVAETLDLLQAVSDMSVDALIVQDPGVFALVRRWFPQVRLHASTLMTAHNHAGVNQLARMGAERVVLARELGIQEIEQIAGKTRVDLEMFVHGALCFSYSGMCLASSFRGGQSGLRGRCVQPCRLRFRQGRKEGYFLSCNDFCGLPLIPHLKRLRIASFKIEGRMKSADYIAQVVRAYRLVLDAGPGEEPSAIRQGQEWLNLSPSRRLTTGYLKGEADKEILTPHRSGSSGLWVATVQEASARGTTVLLRHDLQAGDRLRPEAREGHEEEIFEVDGLATRDGDTLDRGRSGERTLLITTANLSPGMRLFKVGRRASPPQTLWKRLRREVARPAAFRKRFLGTSEEAFLPGDPVSRDETRDTLILKVGDVKDLLRALDLPARQVLLSATPTNLERLAKIKLSGKQRQLFSWSLPPLIAEKQLEYYRAAVGWYLKKGFIRWELNNWGHFDFFPEEGNQAIMAGSRLNVRNVAALKGLADLGCRRAVLCDEITRSELEFLARESWPLAPVLCVFGWPPLFSSRLRPGLDEDRPFFTPRKEGYVYKRLGDFSFVYADRPFSWFGQLDFLRSAGYRQHLVDASDGPHGSMPPLEQIVQAYFHQRPLPGQSSLFNLERRP
jgi:putative protease